VGASVAAQPLSKRHISVDIYSLFFARNAPRRSVTKTGLCILATTASNCAGVIEFVDRRSRQLSKPRG